MEANLQGLKGEYVVARVLGTRVDERSLLTGDDGNDLTLNGLTIQVKFNNYPYGDLYVNTLEELQSDVAILTTRTEDPSVVEIKGWVDRDTFKKKATTRDYGYGPRFALDQKELVGLNRLR